MRKLLRVAADIRISTRSASASLLLSLSLSFGFVVAATAVRKQIIFTVRPTKQSKTSVVHQNSYTKVFAAAWYQSTPSLLTRPHSNQQYRSFNQRTMTNAPTHDYPNVLSMRRCRCMLKSTVGSFFSFLLKDWGHPTPLYHLKRANIHHTPACTNISQLIFCACRQMFSWTNVWVSPLSLPGTAAAFYSTRYL